MSKLLKKIGTSCPAERIDGPNKNYICQIDGQKCKDKKEDCIKYKSYVLPRKNLQTEELRKEFTGVI